MCKQFHSRRLERWSKRTVGEECLVLGEYVSARVRGLMPDVEGVLSVHLDVSLMKKLHQVVDDVFRGDREEIGAGWELKTE